MAVSASSHILPHIVEAPPVMLLPATLIGCIFLAYLIGSIPFGLILGKLYKIGDLRTIGSGNIGATNMLRAGGKKLAIATLALDMAKGYLAVLVCTAIAQRMIAARMAADTGIKLDYTAFYYFFGFYAVVGHIWPIWLKGKGGKGVATALGVLFAFSPVVGLLAIACWLATFAVTTISSLSALVSIALAPFAATALINKSAGIAVFGIALIVYYRHKDNIVRLIGGTEPKIDLKASRKSDV